jgi:toprim domain protein
MADIMSKVIIVEGITDKKQLERILAEPVEIACTYGTLGLDKLEELITEYSEEDVWVLLDADDAGDKARRSFKQEFPNVRHLYTHRMYREVATTPFHVLAQILEGAHFAVKLPDGEKVSNNRRSSNRINNNHS